MRSWSERSFGWQELVLLLGSLVAAGLDVVLLGVAVAFGPTGFGGDGAVTAHRAAVDQAGELAGCIGLVLTGVALLAVLVLSSPGARRRTLVGVLGGQMAMIAALIVSMAYA